ncbi:MAG: GHKL domain-containing protein, partial [Lachnospiraceae bacterium]|nr:GHKL domain-containing protein [Lachnospiraceae bacterium]
MNIRIISNSILCEYMEILPFRLFALYLFRRHLRLPVWAAVLFTCVLQIVQALTFTYVIEAHFPAQPVDCGFEVIFLIFLLFSSRMDKWRMLFQYIFILDYYIATHGISLVLDAVFFHGPRRQMDSALVALATLMIFAMSAPLVRRFLRKSEDLIAEINAPFFWRTVWLLPAINTLIVLMYTNKITREDLMKPQYLVSRVLLFLSMFLVYLILTSVLDVIRRETVLEEQAAQQKQFMAAERTRHEQLERYLMEMRQIKHDNIQHLRVMNTYLENEDYDALKLYMRQYEQSLPQNAPQIWCVNHVANVLISYYAGEFQSNGIKFSAEAILPEQLPVSDPDFCSILGNLLENALAACLEASELSPFVKLRAMASKEQVSLIMDNTSSQPPKMEGDIIYSTKHEGIGIGTASIRSVAGKYHGNVQFHYQDHVFYASILLFSPEADPGQAVRKLPIRVCKKQMS